MMMAAFGKIQYNLLHTHTRKCVHNMDVAV